MDLMSVRDFLNRPWSGLIALLHRLPPVIVARLVVSRPERVRNRFRNLFAIAILFAALLLCGCVTYTPNVSPDAPDLDVPRLEIP